MKSVDFRNDPMFLRNQFARDGTFEIPIIKKTKLDLDNIEFVGYDIIKGGGAAAAFSGTSLPTKGKPNTKRGLYKNGKLIQERIYDEKGLAKTDIDYTNHGNPAKHPHVPHEHYWDWSNPEHPIRR